MLPRLEFEPDIEKKFDHLITHINQKNQATHGLVKIMKDICNLESFYSNSLNKFAGAICQLLKGKDPIKQILITLQQIIASKVTQSQNLANQIKNDIIPHFEQSIDLKAQQKLKEKHIQVRNIRQNMQKKVRMLFANENNFRKAVSQVNSLPKIMNLADREKALQIYRKKQDQFSDAIDSYNSSLNDYMIKYSQICELMIELQTKRKNQFRDATIKIILHQLQSKKSFQYDIASKSDKLGRMQSKLMIQDKSLDSGQAFYEMHENKTIHLGKISNKNYIDSIVGKKKMNENLLGEQIKISELKLAYEPGEISKQAYHSLVKTIYPIMNFIHRSQHVNLLIQIVLFSRDIYIKQSSLKLTLLNSLLTHELFVDQNFWRAYQKRLMDKISREENLAKGDDKFLKRSFSNVLDRDILMLTNCDITPCITSVIQNVCERAKLAIVVRPPDFLSNSLQNNQRKKQVKSKLKQRSTFFLQI